MIGTRPHHRHPRVGFWFSTFNPRTSVVFSPSAATDVKLIFASVRG